jgi:hypothetical protein
VTLPSTKHTNTARGGGGGGGGGDSQLKLLMRRFSKTLRRGPRRQRLCFLLTHRWAQVPTLCVCMYVYVCMCQVLILLVKLRPVTQRCNHPDALVVIGVGQPVRQHAFRKHIYLHTPIYFRTHVYVCTPAFIYIYTYMYVYQHICTGSKSRRPDAWSLLLPVSTIAALSLGCATHLSRLTRMCDTPVTPNINEIYVGVWWEYGRFFDSQVLRHDVWGDSTRDLCG